MNTTRTRWNAYIVRLMRKLASFAGNLSACDKAVKIIQYVCRVLLWYYGRYLNNDTVDSIEHVSVSPISSVFHYFAKLFNCISCYHT
jgi:hypothetical protein